MYCNICLEILLQLTFKPWSQELVSGSHELRHDRDVGHPGLQIGCWCLGKIVSPPFSTSFKYLTKTHTFEKGGKATGSCMISEKTWQWHWDTLGLSYSAHKDIYSTKKSSSHIILSWLNGIALTSTVFHQFGLLQHILHL